jgi:hypothetical protein
MGRRILFVVVALAGLAVLGLANLRPGPDAPIPAALVTWIEPAREAARSSAGLAAFAPARFIEARCTADGRAAVLTFESAVGSFRAYATMGFPSAADWSLPGATVTIIGSSHADVSISAEPGWCDRVAVSPTAPSGGPRESNPDGGARLAVDIGGTIGCATFPYGCYAKLSLLPAGTTVTRDWRPPASDPWWSPDYVDATSADHFEQEPIGSLPMIPPGNHQVVISLLGSYDTPSYAPDGTVATDLLARCIGKVEVGPESSVVNVRVTFTPDGASFRASCTVNLNVDRE